MSTDTKRKCKEGHYYYKSSDCPTCPVCEKMKKPATGFLSLIAAPARRALESQGITSLKKLSALTETGILELHGVGPSALPKLRVALAEEGLKFRNG
jgi:hypothetical protein